MPFNLFVWPTNELSRFVWPLVDEGLKGLLHRIDETLIPCKAALRHIVHLVLEVQQVLHHVLVFLWSADNLSTEGLRPEGVSTKCAGIFKRQGHIFLMALLYLYISWFMCLPLCNLSRTAAVWEALPSPCWRADRGGSAQSHGSHPAGCSDLPQ